PSAAAAFRLAEALRRLGALAVGTAAPDSVLDEAAAAVDAASDRLAPYAEPSRYEQAQRLGGACGVFLNHPIMGPVNPLAPPGAAAAFRLAEALRRLGALAVGTAAPDSVLDEAAAAVDAASDRLAPYAEPSRYEQAQRLGGACGVFLNHPIMGPVNPLAPRVV